MELKEEKKSNYWVTQTLLLLISVTLLKVAADHTTGYVSLVATNGCVYVVHCEGSVKTERLAYY
jgi:hypothetical protein